MMLDLMAAAPSSDMNPQMLNAWLVIAVMPVTSVITLVLQNIFARRKNSSDAQNQKSTARVSEMDVAFDGIVANLNSVAEQLKEVRTELRDTKADSRRTQDDLNTTRSDLRRLETQVSDLRLERLHFLSHIALLETLIPMPPGPPKRPSFMNDDSGR